MEYIYIVELNEIPRREEPAPGTSSFVDGKTIATVALAGAFPIAGAGIALGKFAWDKLSDKSDGKVDTQDDDFLREHGVTISMTEEFELMFPPSHPKLHHLYRLHPLAQKNSAEYAGRYLPIEKYDEVLLAERKAELIRLLVDLGATHVSLATEHADTDSATTSGHAGVESEAGTGHAEGSMGRRRGTTNIAHETHEYDGKPWHKGDRVNRGDYAWLEFEPTWKSIVKNREEGGVKKTTGRWEVTLSNTSDLGISTSMKAKIVNLDASLQRNTTRSTRDVMILSVEFSPAL